MNDDYKNSNNLENENSAKSESISNNASSVYDKDMIKDAKLNIDFISQSIVEGNYDNIALLDSIITSLGYIPPEIASSDLINTLINLISNIQLQQPQIQSIIHILSMCLLSNDDIQEIPQDFEKLLMFYLHSNNIAISSCTLVIVTSLARNIKFCQDFINLGIFESILVLSAEESSDKHQVASLLVNLLHGIPEDKIFSYFCIFNQSLILSSETVQKSLLYELVNYVENNETKLLENNVQIILLDFLSNKELRPLAAKILMKISQKCGYEIFNDFDFNHILIESLNLDDDESLFSIFMIYIGLIDNSIIPPNEEIINILFSVLKNRNYEVRLSCIDAICSNLFVMSGNDDIYNEFISPDVIDSFLNVLEGEHELLNEKILSCFIHVVTNSSIVLQAFQNDEIYQSLADLDFENPKLEELLDKLLDILGEEDEYKI